MCVKLHAREESFSAIGKLQTRHRQAIAELFSLVVCCRHEEMTSLLRSTSPPTSSRKKGSWAIVLAFMTKSFELHRRLKIETSRLELPDDADLAQLQGASLPIIFFFVSLPSSAFRLFGPHRAKHCEWLTSVGMRKISLNFIFLFSKWKTMKEKFH